MIGKVHGGGRTISPEKDGWKIENIPGGIVQMTKTVERSVSNYNTYGPFYGFYIDISFPIKLKLGYQAHIEWQIGAGFSIPAGNLSRSSTGFRAYGMGTGNGSQNCKIDILVIGEKE